RLGVQKPPDEREHDRPCRIARRLHDDDTVELLRRVVGDVAKVAVRGDEAEPFSQRMVGNRAVGRRTEPDVPNIGGLVAPLAEQIGEGKLASIKTCAMMSRGDGVVALPAYFVVGKRNAGTDVLRRDAVVLL